MYQAKLILSGCFFFFFFFFFFIVAASLRLYFEGKGNVYQFGLKLTENKTFAVASAKEKCNWHQVMYFVYFLVTAIQDTCCTREI